MRINNRIETERACVSYIPARTVRTACQVVCSVIPLQGQEQMSWGRYERHQGGASMSGKSPSNAFNEVRAILGKLDRSIDEARSKRLEPDQPVRREPVAEPGQSSDSVSDLDREIGGGNTPAAKTELQRKGASFGRAKPLNRGGDNGADREWKSPGSDELIG
jgi:hypothetical protein